MTVFEPKYPLLGCYGTDAIPLNHPATTNVKCLKWDLKDSPICLDSACFQPKKQNRKIIISGLSLHFFNRCSKFIFLKNASITHFKLNSWRQNPETTKFFKNKVKIHDYRMKWIVLSYSESYFQETKNILVKFY